MACKYKALKGCMQHALSLQHPLKENQVSTERIQDSNPANGIHVQKATQDGPVVPQLHFCIQASTGTADGSAEGCSISTSHNRRSPCPSGTFAGLRRSVRRLGLAGRSSGSKPRCWARSRSARDRTGDPPGRARGAVRGARRSDPDQSAGVIGSGAGAGEGAGRGRGFGRAKATRRVSPLGRGSGGSSRQVNLGADLKRRTASVVEILAGLVLVARG